LRTATLTWSLASPSRGRRLRWNSSPLRLWGSGNFRTLRGWGRGEEWRGIGERGGRRLRFYSVRVLVGGALWLAGSSKARIADVANQLGMVWNAFLRLGRIDTRLTLLAEFFFFPFCSVWDIEIVYPKEY
jgi:hypothetical protein